jgi:hypothetical protein
MKILTNLEKQYVVFKLIPHHEVVDLSGKYVMKQQVVLCFQSSAVRCAQIMEGNTKND